MVHLFEYFGIHRTPINGFELAHKLGIHLVPYSTLSKNKRKAAMKISKDGFFLETKDDEMIYFNDENSTENYGRINMTILHEIGMTCLGMLDLIKTLT